jgi:hypothetical protein
MTKLAFELRTNTPVNTVTPELARAAAGRRPGRRCDRVLPGGLIPGPAAACGHIVTAVPVCSHCEEPLDARSVTAVPGPGSADGDFDRTRLAVP